MPFIRKNVVNIRCLIMEISKKLMDPSDQLDGLAKMIDGSIDGSIYGFHGFHKKVHGIGDLLDGFN
jgi:hypothetical protein